MSSHPTRVLARFGTACVAATCALMSFASAPARAQQGAPNGEWPAVGGDLGNTKYSALDQIGRDNWRQVEIVWRWRAPTDEVTAVAPRLKPGQFKATPLMVGGRLFVSTAFSQVAAIDARTGVTLWLFDPESWRAGLPPAAGFQHRGVAYWREDPQPATEVAEGAATRKPDERIFIATHDRRLFALDAATGQPIAGFGTSGAVDLERNLGREIDARGIGHSSPPAVCNDAVIIGSVVREFPSSQEAPPGHVRAFDARTGELLWIFHTIAQEGEDGNATWENGSWRYTGAANVWGTLSGDEELDLVYLATGTPTNDYYGGHRLGDNLFAESIVAVDCRTGKKAWHFQGVHHGLWDYDFPTAPTLFDLKQPDGTVYKGLAASSKQAFLYVFDRRTGEPRWPIEERPVPQTDVPGEKSSPTQPFPTKPAAFDRQGFSVDELIDFTPELRAEALAIVAKFKMGPLFTPPVLASDELEGVLQLPGTSGGGWWPGAGLDPETGTIFIGSVTHPVVTFLTRPDAARSDARYLGDNLVPKGPRDLPLTKPPYGRITAIEMTGGEHVWMTPHGEGPRNHPAIRHLDLPALGSRGAIPVGGGGPLVTKTLLFVGQGSTGRESKFDRIPKLNVFDKKSGQHLGHLELPAMPYGNPMTYQLDGRQVLVVAVGGGLQSGRDGPPAELIALALPRAEEAGEPSDGR